MLKPRVSPDVRPRWFILPGTSCTSWFRRMSGSVSVMTRSTRSGALTAGVETLKGGCWRAASRFGLALHSTHVTIAITLCNAVLQCSPAMQRACMMWKHNAIGLMRPTRVQITWERPVHSDAAARWWQLQRRAGP